MHFHFDFSASQILWTLTFAAELVLLVVLMGRDRTRRFPWFTANIVGLTLLLLVSRLLFGRMSAAITTIIFLVLSNITAVLGVLVVVEIARRAFAGASRAAWLAGTLIALIIAATVLVLWGPWPPRSTFTGASGIIVLRTMQMIADKGATLGALLGIELGILTVLFGRRFHGGWRSHPQMIAIGLSTAGISQLAVRAVWQLVATRITIHSQAEYQHALDLRDRIYNANNLLFFLVLIWWIAWLWFEEPGTVSPAAVLLEQASEVPAVEEPPLEI